MAKQKMPSIEELYTSQGARFLRLPKNLTKVAVQNVFEQVLAECKARRITQEIRIARGSDENRFVYSFLCFRMTSPVPFLITSELTEVRYGFVLLIEREGYLAIFS